LVFEYLDNNLLEVLERHPSGLPNRLITCYIYQVLEGLAYMHSLSYLHRDIKPENLLVNAKGTLKICDMGFAQSLHERMTDYVATRWYRPPELLLGAKYGTPIDIWAVGCIIAELSSAQPLFPGTDDIDQLALILGRLGDLPHSLKTAFHSHPVFQNIHLPAMEGREESFGWLKPKLTEKGVDLLKQMLKLDPRERITAS
jgi:cyclin-dependent kinase-like